MTSWLQRQRKQALLDLSSEAGFEQEDDLRKDDIVDALDAYLQQNATRLSSNSTFDPYYGVRRTPFKARSSSTAGGITSDDGEVKSVVKGRGRRATKVKQEFDDADHDNAAYSPAGPSNIASALAPITSSVPTSTALTKRTPGRPRRSETQLPASPADVANLAEYETTQFYAGLNDMYSVSGVPETIDYIRESCSSVTGVQMAFLLLEAFGLQRTVLPWKYSGIDITYARPGMGLPRIPLWYPDLFQVLTPEFWIPTLTFFATSLVIPSLFGYFFNLTTREVKRHGATVSVARYTVDPLMFNVAKCLLTMMVYNQGLGDAIVGSEVVDVLKNGMVGTMGTVLIGTYVCMLVSVYEAAQLRK